MKKLKGKLKRISFLLGVFTLMFFFSSPAFAATNPVESVVPVLSASVDSVLGAYTSYILKPVVATMEKSNATFVKIIENTKGSLTANSFTEISSNIFDFYHDNFISPLSETLLVIFGFSNENQLNTFNTPKITSNTTTSIIPSGTLEKSEGKTNSSITYITNNNSTNRGPQGIAGLQGPRGLQGPAGISNINTSLFVSRVEFDNQVDRIFNSIEHGLENVSSNGGSSSSSTTATNLAGGLGGEIPYQSAAGTTAFLANGTAGQILQSNGTTLAPSWITIGGGGDMVLASTQTVTGAKTFNNGMLLLRNVANTFNGSFTNTNTADRVYTLKDASGTLAFTSDITGINSGTNTGDVTLAAFGSTPNANGASLSGQVLILQPADGSNPGGVSTTTQTFAGAKTFTSNTTISKIDPSLVLLAPGSDTDFWLSVTDDGGNDDDDLFQIGDGATPGTNPFFSIDTNGYVGIGTTAPESALQVNADVTTILTAQFNGNYSSSDFPVIQVRNDGDASVIGFNTYQGNEYALGVNTGHDFIISAGRQLSTAPVITILDASNNVGISTTGPGKQLEINSATGDNLRLTYNDSNGSATNYADLLTSSSGDLTIVPSGGDVAITGNLGIGTMTPKASLDIYANTGTTTTSSDINSLGTGTGNITVGSTAGWPTQGVLVYNRHSYFEEAMAYTVVNGTTLNITARGLYGTTAQTQINGNPLTYTELFVSKGTSSVPRLSVNSEGLVGIGTISPGGSLEVSGDGRANLVLTKDHTEIAAPSGLTVADSYLHLGGREDGVNSYRLISFGYQYGGNFPPPAYMGFQQTSSSGWTFGDLVFGTRPDDTSTTATERMRINSSGNVGIGTTAPTSLLHVDNTTSLALGVNASGYTATIQGAFTEAGSGTHPLIAGLRVSPPTITGGTAAVTDTATLYVSAGTVASGANNFAMFIDGDASNRIDGSLQLRDNTNVTRFLLDTTDAFSLSNGFAIKFGSAGVTSPDVGIVRASAGLLEVNSSISGSYRDLRVRKLFYGHTTSASAWGLNGIALENIGVTYTDSSSTTGTVTNAVFNSFAQPTITGSAGTVTYTNAATLYVANAPTTSGDESITNPYALWVDAGTARFDGDVVISGTCTGCGGGSAIWNSITNPTGTQSLTFDDAELNSWIVSSDTETFQTITANSLTTGKVLSVSSSSLSSGTLIDFVVTGTAAASNTQKVLNISTSGANATSTQTTYGGYFSNTHTGTSSTNVGLYATATGGTNNYAAIFEAGNVGIGTTAPDYKFQIGTGSTTVFGNTVYDSVIFDSDYPYSAWRTASGVETFMGAESVGAYGDFGTASNHPMNIGTNSLVRMTIEAGGEVGIATTLPDRQLEINSAAGNNLRLTYNDADGSATNYADLLMSSSGDLTIAPSGGDANVSGNFATTSVDLGNGVAGYVLTLGRNTNATNTGAGSINFQSKGGTAGYVWQDNAGNMRIHTAAPSNANDTAGTVIGTQTSTRATKQDIEDYTDYNSALSMVIGAPLHTFKYIKDVQGYGEDSVLAKTRIGYIADEVPGEFMWGNSIDQVSVNGILLASVKALDLKINDINNLDIENDWRDSLIAWLGNATNRITRIFTGEICLTSPGEETVCLNRAELQELKGLLNGEISTPEYTPPDSDSNPESEPTPEPEVTPEPEPDSPDASQGEETPPADEAPPASEPSPESGL